MTIRFSSRLLACVAPLALLAPPAYAQTEQSAEPTATEPTGPEDAGGLKDIVVTARKRVENLQDVPTAITALGAEQIADLQIESFQDVGRTAPNVHVQKQSGSPSAPQFNIRGVSAGSLNFQIDSGVALYLDGVYLGRPGNSSFDLADIDRLEVLRGPQGTLFGRNSTGGAVSFTTAVPTGEFGVLAEATIGNFASRRARMTLNTPEWAGFSARLTYVHAENTGNVRNSGPRRTFLFPEPFGPAVSPKTYGESNVESLFAAVRYDGVENLTVDYKFDYTDTVTTLDAVQLLVAGPVFRFLSGFDQQPALGGTNVVDLKRRDALSVDGLAPATQKTWGHSLTAVYDISDMFSVKYIGGLRGFTVNTSSDLDGNALVDPAGSGGFLQMLAAERYAKQRQSSHELQFLGQSDNFDFVGGLYHLREKAYVNAQVMFASVSQSGQPIPITNPGSYLAGGDLTRVLNKSYAAFAHANVRPFDALEIGAGIRYSKDDRAEDDLLDAPRVVDPATGEIILDRGRFTAKQDRIDYDLSARFEFAEHSNVYAKFATGFVSGGIFHGAEFEPETVKSYELGLKTEFLDRRVRLNVALFQADRSDLQIGAFDPNQGGNILLNTGKERARGVEVETTIVPVRGLTLTANYGFTDVERKLTTNNPLATPVRTFQPRHTGYLAAMYEFGEFEDGTKMTFRVDGQYEGKHFRLNCPYGTTQSPTEGCLGTSDPVIDRQLIIPATWDVGARFTFADIPVGPAKGRISLWGKNLLDNDEFEYLFGIVDWTLGTFQQPRTYGIDFAVQF